MKIEQIKYGLGHQRIFYIAENNTALFSVVAHVLTPASGEREVWFRPLQYGIWDLDFTFSDIGKYLFVVFVDGIKTLVLIITIENYK